MNNEELFPEQKQSSERISVGNGYSIEWASLKIVIIYRLGVPFKHTEIKAQIDKRRLAVELVFDCGATKYLIARALNISRQSLDNWVKTYQMSGYEGLVNSYKGSIKTGRKEKASELPTGNKARNLEEKRRLRREEDQKNQLYIEVAIAETSQAQEKARSDLFDESYDFEENRYAGSFIYLGIFQHYFKAMELFSSHAGQYAIVLHLFCMMLVNHIPTVEQLKTVFKREFGRVLGVRQLFSKPILWENIRNLCILRKSESLIEEFFKRQAKLGLVVLYWLYIDGHFIPYYGKEKIRSGYYTQRDAMMPGQTEIFVHDCRGKIVYFELQEGKGDLKEMMRRMSTQWASYIGGKPLMIADRECWGVDHFISMNENRFVTWEKSGKPEELRAIPDSEFGEKFQVNDKEYRASEGKKTYSNNTGNSIELRRIVIWNQKSDKRSACVTGADEPEDTISIARAMLGRWGCSENSFKHIGERCNIHYNPMSDTTEYSENTVLSNPEYQKLKARVKELKKSARKTDAALGRLPMTTNKDGALRKSKRRENLRIEREKIKEELAVAEDKLSKCPEKINVKDMNSEDRIKKLDTEGKNLWDLSQSLFWNSRKILIEEFGKYLPDCRDTISALEAITKSRGWIRSTSEAIEIRMEPLETPRFGAAQIQLCRKLNEMEIRLLNGKRLLYDVADRPTDCPKI